MKRDTIRKRELVRTDNFLRMDIFMWIWCFMWLTIKKRELVVGVIWAVSVLLFLLFTALFFCLNSHAIYNKQAGISKGKMSLMQYLTNPRAAAGAVEKSTLNSQKSAVN